LPGFYPGRHYYEEQDEQLPDEHEEQDFPPIDFEMPPSELLLAAKRDTRRFKSGDPHSGHDAVSPVRISDSKVLPHLRQRNSTMGTTVASIRF